MPIYAYKCASCGHAKDALQKMSDQPLTVCPECGEASFQKQVTAAGFQLKGSGWYVTDFRGGTNAGAPVAAAATEGGGESAAKPDAAPAASASATPASAPAPASAAPSPAPASAPASSPSSGN